MPYVTQWVEVGRKKGKSRKVKTWVPCSGNAKTKTGTPAGVGGTFGARVPLAMFAGSLAIRKVQPLRSTRMVETLKREPKPTRGRQRGLTLPTAKIMHSWISLPKESVKAPSVFRSLLHFLWGCFKEI